ncbi:unnamed protein product [Heterobilharzia americana]|nr:unnamed protein product [Heterobilharzia americana]
MSEVLLNDSAVKQEYFEDDESLLKSDVFDSVPEGLSGELTEIGFDNGCPGVIGRDPYGDLFLMDPNDLLGVREEVIGNDTSNSPESVPVCDPCIVTADESNDSTNERANQRRKKARIRNVNLSKPEIDNRELSDLDDGSQTNGYSGAKFSHTYSPVKLDTDTVLGNVPYVLYSSAAGGLSGKGFIVNRRYSTAMGHKQIHVWHGQPRYRRHFALGSNATIATRFVPQSKSRYELTVIFTVAFCMKSCASNLSLFLVLLKLDIEYISPMRYQLVLKKPTSTMFKQQKEKISNAKTYHKYAIR